MVIVDKWEPSLFVDGWAFAILKCGHRVAQENRSRPRSKRCSQCWLAARMAKLEPRRIKSGNRGA